MKPKNLVEGSAEEEATESPSFEKKEDSKAKGKKPTKKVSAKGAQLLAQLMKNKGKKTAVPAKAAIVDAEDLKDGGADEDKEKE